ncbi:glutamine--fructose-6-phosphate aminotransferase [Candidatus Kaiserbacteria bacterium RIFCSPHIGHO2_01_FULL_50_13]|uniref:Glutamine--fructose-6-phosphate aminotransferase [isomerizing] n=1 Tax=Candidatus Kaiserbacteria bacterium RIFCSPLOWO2_01_FULL_50_24 TaxID=1798507 RepID=A0A1F6ENB1_9BACT|nr:MAG: glutamine--fructose-6-phosphate aminotransferase [Candidatus Kaiserbacteria bacterium RIFCSPHIGHO2_01_FULL_50_13]OGG75129.1 MAG: glutamine--fructose-6-phosphate aminotransferase [Candidatus Kaiserbacteria bacterium RIFCSPLOWO2_01_FULL_50_24]OGG82219.1 MAG: glutamine--fructose-6-phosphate aminotransferase [Candidatus Kaiserbacteria bacterium RIFCSPLOWO2_02_FULL_51_13]
MCGIFAYTGSKNAGPLLLKGLVSLEYRGYDSAGVFMPESGVVRAKGAVAELRKKIPKNFTGRSGIAHLRWATHGEPSEKNAHPHADCGGNIYVAHNGIIENFRELKRALQSKGHTFRSDTDTEVLAHLIEEHMAHTKKFEHAVLTALHEVRGTYGLVAQCKANPDKIVAARMGSPVVLGVGTRERFVASDPSPIIPHTQKVIFLEDGEVAVIMPTSHAIVKLDATKVKRGATTIDWGAEKVKKNGHKHFMLKEIMEGPEVLENTLRGRLVLEKGRAKLGGLESVAKELKKIERFIIVACGTAYYAGLIGEYMLEEYAGIPVEVELGSEFRYRSPVLNQRTAVIAISQSGETADTLAAVREGKKRGALTLGIVNAVGSTIARETDAGVYNHAGPEMGVASTKALISQLEALVLFTLFFGRERQMSLRTGCEIAQELKTIPEKVAVILANHGKIEKLAKKYAYARDFLFIGRKYNYPVALEGAIKLKEVSYIHAEGYASGEMKHGPIAMIDKKFPTVAVVPSDSVYEKNLSNIHELKARGGPVIAIATEGNTEIAKIADDCVYVPKTIEILSPILSVVPLQLFAYYMAHQKGLNPDRPRNLAKSVTVE